MYLSHFLSNTTPGYAGSTSDIVIKKNSCMDHGDSSNSLRIELKNHVGTHIDLPRHFDPAGKVLNDYPASFWFFHNVQLLDLPCKEGHIISVKDLEGKIKSETDCLLIRTGFEKKRQTEAYWNNNPGVDKNVGQFLRTNFPKLKVFGFDFISLTSFTNRPLGREAHKGFLGPFENKEPVLILEDMKLAELTGHPEKLIIAPFMIDQADGGPVTVIAFP
jgi:arylformamidase